MRVLLCLFVTLASPGFAYMSSPEDQLRVFATCAGRLMGQLEHEWLNPTERVEIIEAQRAQIVEILDMIVPEGRGREVLSWRVDARAAQRGLLQRARFAENHEDRDWAAAMAEHYLADCSGFLLS